MSGLYGGRGNYTAKLKIFDIGYGGPEPDDGDLIFEMPSYNYTCKPKCGINLLFLI
jgi:E3 ubiquitin-protein ligase MYCBP2